MKKFQVFVSTHLLCGDSLHIIAILCYLYFLTSTFQIEFCYVAQTGLEPSASCLFFLPARVFRLYGLCICCVVLEQSLKVCDRRFRTLFRPSGTFLKAQHLHFLSFISEVSPNTKYMHV